MVYFSIIIYNITAKKDGQAFNAAILIEYIREMLM